jgi:[ribosomal protein S5]-alanine N-acetyltransferase
MITLRPVLGADAPLLFPLLYQTHVCDTLLWDGPPSLEDYAARIALSEADVRRGAKHMFTIVETATERPAGTASVRPEDVKFRGDVGLWIGEPFHGKGYGTLVVRELVRYAFDVLAMEKLEASVFTGNIASRRIFEKNGFQLEGTIRKATKKRGSFLDDWIFGITREEYLAKKA